MPDEKTNANDALRDRMDRQAESVRAQLRAHPPARVLGERAAPPRGPLAPPVAPRNDPAIFTPNTADLLQVPVASFVEGLMIRARLTEQEKRWVTFLLPPGAQP